MLWDDCHDPMMCVSGLREHSKTLGHMAFELATQWDDCDDLVQCVQPEHVLTPLGHDAVSNMCWEDTDDLAHPWSCNWLNPPYYPWKGRSSAHLSPSSVILLRAVVGDCGQRTHDKKGPRTSPNQRTRWRRYRFACREAAQYTNSRLRHPTTTKGHRLGTSESSWIEDCASLGVNVCSLPSDGGAGDFSYVSGDGNCLWRAVWAATAAEQNWKRLKTKVLHPHAHLHKYRPAGVLVGATCYAAIANYLGCALHVQLHSTTVLFVPVGDHVRKRVHLRVHDNHAQPACPATAASARRKARSGVYACDAQVRHMESSLNRECSQVGDEAHNTSALSDSCMSSLIVGAKDSDRVHPCMVLRHRCTRRQRYQVHLDSDPSFALFVDKDLSFEVAKNRIALHMGLDPERAHVHVDQECTRVVCATTRISPSQTEILTKLAMRTPLNRRVRSLAGSMVEAFL
eukprot:3613079-Amphidinium_carterae.2